MARHCMACHGMSGRRVSAATVATTTTTMTGS
jgi:hypothetical protein